MFVKANEREVVECGDEVCGDKEEEIDVQEVTWLAMEAVKQMYNEAKLRMRSGQGLGERWRKMLVAKSMEILG